MAYGMDTMQAPGSPESRTGAFGVGTTEAKLDADSQRFNAQVPHGVRLSSVLQPPRVAMNGMADSDYNRLLPGMQKPMPSANGMSAGNFEKALMIRLQGGGE